MNELSLKVRGSPVARGHGQLVDIHLFRPTAAQEDG